MQDFLSGENFEKMAREYYKKYSKINTLSNEMLSENLCVDTLNDIFSVCVYLKKNCTGERFSDMFQAGNALFDELSSLKNKFDISDFKDKNLKTFRDFSSLVFEVVYNFYQISKVSTAFDKIYPLFLETISAYFCVK